MVAVLCLGFLPLLAPSPAQAVPHGCASASSDYSVALEPLARRLVVKVHSNEPCTFIHAEGDTFSGIGRFTVTCSTGGAFHHPDDLPDGSPNPPVVQAPIPQPCAVGATVTLNGYHAFTGGSVIGGGMSEPPKPPSPRVGNGEFRDLCARGSEPTATVAMTEPVNRSGLLTYVGTVRCDGATIAIRSLTVTPLGGFSYPSAGAVRCTNCKRAVSVSGTVPAKGWVYEVDMTFAVHRPGHPTVRGSRLGRYVVTWAGNVTTLCPGLRAGPLPPDDTEYVNVPGGETCPI